MTTPREEFQEGILQKETWRHAELARFQVALRGVALEKSPSEPWFAADEVPEEFHGDRHTPGCALAALQAAHLIEPCLVHRPDRGINHGRRNSVRAARKSAKVFLWQLVSRPMAVEFLRRHGAGAADPFQPELFQTASAVQGGNQ